MSIHRFKYLFQQFVNKTASVEETAEFLSMMKRDDYNQEVKILLDEFWQNSSSITPLDQEKAEKIFNLIMTTAEAKKSAGFHVIGEWVWFQAVAAILIIIGISALFYKWEVKPSRPELSQITKNKVDKPERRIINLPDGSVVILNKNSNVRFDDKFNRNGKREVYLQGEAYFDVKHDASHPFIVYTGKLKTTVLGTAFNINVSPENGIVTVTVTRGKVKVGDSKRTFNVITPDEQVIFNNDLTQHIKKTVKAETVIEWKNEDIYFDDVYMKDVANQLQERFNVSILFSNENIKDLRFSATFLKSQTLEQILHVIGEFNHIKYQFQDKNTVMLIPNAKSLKAISK